MAAWPRLSIFDCRLVHETDLLGTGGVQAKMLLIASTERGRFAEHVNIGYTVAEGQVAGTPLGLSAASDSR